MAKMTPRTLSGFMELLPAPQQQMERIMEVLRKTYSLLRLHAPGYPCHRIQRGAAGQGRRRDGKADLPLPEGRQRPLPSALT